MGRELQHIAVKSDVSKADYEGQKVRMLCGAAHYPMSEMKDSIPTCSKCMRTALQEWNEYATNINATSTWTATITATTFEGRWTA